MTAKSAWRIVRNRLTSPGPTGAAAYTNDRVHPVVLPQDADLPAVTYQVLTAPREHAFGQDEGTVHARVQVDVYDDSYLGTASGGKRVRDALSRFAGTATGITVHEIMLDNERDLYEERLENPERTLWRRSLDFIIHYDETD